MATKLKRERDLQENIVTPACEGNKEPEYVPTQDEVDARARKIAARLLKQHAKTWEELAKY